MLLDLSNKFEANKATTRLNKLIAKGSKIELTEKKPKRSLKQSAYEHILFTLFAMEFGYDIEYVKQKIFKIEVNRSIFKDEYIDSDNRVVICWKSTADLKTDEATLSIDRFRSYSSTNGLYLPTPEEYMENSFYIDQSIDKYKEWV